MGRAVKLPNQTEPNQIKGLLFAFRTQNTQIFNRTELQQTFPKNKT